MAYPIKNTTLQQTNTVRTLNFAFGVNQGGYGLTSSTAFWNGKSTNNQNGYVAYVGSGTSSPKMYLFQGDTDVIQFATTLGCGYCTTIQLSLFYIINSSNAICLNADPPNIVTSGLTLYLDAGLTISYPKGLSTWFDTSANLTNGTLVNSPGYDSSNYGGITFDGVNQYVNCGNILNYTSGDFSFSYWIYVTSLVTNQPGQGPVIIFKGGYQVNGYYDQIQANGLLFFSTNTSGSNVVTTTPAGTISTGNTYNICYTRSGSSIRIYVNGVDVTVTAGTHVNPATSTDNFLLASYGGSYINSNVKIYSFANYNRQLSNVEVLQNYYAGLQRFINGNNYTLNLWLDGENTNTRVITPTIAYDMGFDLNNCSLMNGMGLAHRDAGTSFYFDGVNNYIDCGSPYHMTAQSFYFSISIWFKIYTTPVGSNTIIKYGATSAGWNIGVSSSGLYYGLYTTGGNYIGGGLGAISLNVWHNVTMTFDYAGAYTLYLDGSVVTTSSAYAGSVCNNGGSTIVNIGRDTNSSTNYFKGSMSIIRSFQNVLTAADVTRIYTAGKQRHGL